MAFALSNIAIATFGAAGGAVSVGNTSAVACSINDVLIVIVSADNIGTVTGVTNQITGVSDDSGFGNVYTKLGEYTFSAGVAADGATVAVFFTRLKGATLTTTTFLGSFSGSSTGRAIRVSSFTCPNPVVQRGTTQTGSAAANTNPGSLTVSSLPAAGANALLAIRATAVEGAAAALTNTAGFTAIAAVDSTGNLYQVGEYQIGNASSYTSAPTIAAANDSASVFAVIGENPPATGGLFMGMM